MQRPKPERLDRATALRYMGAAGWEPDAASSALLDKAEKRLLGIATPRVVWRLLPCEVLPLGNCGRDLARHLEGCREVVVMAATLGSEVDTLLRRMELTDIALAATADAMASVMLEQVCDAWEAELRTEWEPQGRYITGRYAPGYGDCPLELNDAVCQAADSVRGCGVAVTAQHLLVPRKSTTALLGVADHPVQGALAGCATCHLGETCAFRKKGTTCYSR